MIVVALNAKPVLRISKALIHRKLKNRKRMCIVLAIFMIKMLRISKFKENTFIKNLKKELKSRYPFKPIICLV